MNNKDFNILNRSDNMINTIIPLGTLADGNGQTPENFKQQVYDEVSEKFPELANEVLGVVFPDEPQEQQPNPPDLGGMNAAMRKEVIHTFEITVLSQYNKREGSRSDRNIKRNIDRMSVCGLIRRKVTKNLTEKLNESYPINPGDASAGWKTSTSIVDTMQRAVNAHLKSVSLVAVHLQKHYKEEFLNFHYDLKGTLETFNRKFKEQLAQRNLMVHPPLSEVEAVQEYLDRLPSEYDQMKAKMISEEATKATVPQEMQFLYISQGFPVSVSAAITQTSVWSEGTKRIAKESAKTKARSFTSAAHGDDGDLDDRSDKWQEDGRNNLKRRSFTSTTYESDQEDFQSKRRRSRDSPDPGSLVNKETGEIKHWSQISKDDKPSEYGKTKCNICVRMGMGHDVSDHFFKFHDEVICGIVSKAKVTRSNSRDRTSGRRSRSRSRSKERSNSRDRVHFKATK